MSKALKRRMKKHKEFRRKNTCSDPFMRSLFLNFKRELRFHLFCRKLFTTKIGEEE